MRKIKLAIYAVAMIALASCSQQQLPNNLLDDNAGYEKLTNYIYSHYENLKTEGIEVLDISFYSSIHPQRDEISSRISMNFIKGSNKDRVVEYDVNNEGRLTNRIIDITVGEDMLNQKLSNKYETYKPFLFSEKLINLDVLRKIREQAIEDFKKETNVEKAYCPSITISKENGDEILISVRVEQRKFSTSIKRVSTWSIDGKRIK